MKSFVCDDCEGARECVQGCRDYVNYFADEAVRIAKKEEKERREKDVMKVLDRVEEKYTNLEARVEMLEEDKTEKELKYLDFYHRFH